MRGSAYGGASNEKCNRQCAYTILYRCGHRENVEMFGACNSYQNQLQLSKNKPTRKWEHTPSLSGAAQNLSASRNILFNYFQVRVIGMASSQKGKMCHDMSFMGAELLNCGKLLKIDMANYVIAELGQLFKKISVFHEIDSESQTENEYG